jgi:hypothetical protein
VCMLLCVTSVITCVKCMSVSTVCVCACRCKCGSLFELRVKCVYVCSIRVYLYIIMLLCT